jgi:hypothetical protein
MPPERDLDRLCDAVDRVLELVRTELPATDGPAVRDWNDRLLVEAFTRAYRCLRSIRELAGRREAEDAAVLTRALVSLTLQYLWLACAEGDAERRDRLRRLQRKWASERARLGEEMEDLGYFPAEASAADELREQVAQFRAKAEGLREEGVGSVPNDRDLAQQLDRDLQPSQPRFFELVYTRIYRPTSHVAHFGLGAALAGVADPGTDSGALSLERLDKEGAADALGLALVTYAALLDFSEPIIRHGLTPAVKELVEAAHGL